MAHKTLIDGTAYEISGGRTLVDGTGYSIDKGKTLVDGTVYEVGFGQPVTINIITSGSSSAGSVSVKHNNVTYFSSGDDTTFTGYIGDELTFSVAPYVNGVAQSSKTYTVFSDMTILLFTTKEYGSAEHGQTTSTSNKLIASVIDANAQEATITITGGAGSSFCRVEVNSVYYTSATTLKLPVGTVIYAYARDNQGDGYNSRLYLNGSVLKYGGRSMATYAFVVTRNLNISLDYYQSTNDWVQISIVEQ